MNFIFNFYCIEENHDLNIKIKLHSLSVKSLRYILTISSTDLSQVCLGRPGCRLQFLGAGDVQACRKRE